MNHYFNPVSIYFGEASLGALCDKLKHEYARVRRVLLLTRGFEVEKSECLKPVQDILADKDVFIHGVTLNNPDIKDIYQLIQQVNSFDYELIVAIGGGSVMDAAKTLAALQRLNLDSPEDVRKAITGEQYNKQTGFAPWIGIPTTSGTGSEVTSWATIWDEELGCKYSVSDQRLFASAALILPELTLTMPLRLSVSTALDALCHATEAYWSVHTNEISRLYALEAIERIRNALPLLKESPEQLGCREQLSLGSVLAGLAFSNTRTTACHSISYPLTLSYGIDHGIAASVTLATVLKHNYSTLVEPRKLLHAFGAEDVQGVQRFVQSIYELYGLSGNLNDYGVTEEGIAAIIAQAYTKGRMDNNPAPISPEELKHMLVSLL